MYVHALAEPGLPQRFTVRGRRLRTLAFGDVTAVIERGPSPPLTADAVRDQHDLVAALVSRGPAMLPARFGSSMVAADLESAVDRHRAAIRAAFDQVRGCSQMTVRIFGGEAPDHEGRESEAPARTGTEFMTRLRARARREPPAAAVVRRALGSCVKAERMPPVERSGLVTIFHLVANDATDAYRQRAAVLPSALSPLAVTVTGPWPAFAFAPELL